MGREATCMCEWNGEPAQVKALLETHELILRGGIRRRAPFAEMKAVKAEGGRLSFLIGSDRVSLELGEPAAAKWAHVLLKPPPSLAKKLGIMPDSAVLVIGTIDDDALHHALAEANSTARGKADLILARANTPAELAAAFNRAADLTRDGVPLWIAYRKGRGHAINESDVRSAGLAASLVDVKVASVSAELTALKFVKRKQHR